MTVWGASNELYHHGTKGMKWGNRRYQNEDGSLTEAGKKRYGYGEKRGTMRNEAKRQRAFNDMYNDIEKGSKRAEKFKNQEDKHYNKFVKAAEKGNDRKFDKHLDKSNEAMGKKEQALKDVDTASKRMTQGAVKALNMTAKEIDYRKAKRDFDNFTSKAGYLGGPVGVLIGSYATKKGRNFTKQLKVTGDAYREELKGL